MASPICERIDVDAFRLRAFDLLLELPVHGIAQSRNASPSPLTIGVRF